MKNFLYPFFAGVVALCAFGSMIFFGSHTTPQYSGFNPTGGSTYYLQSSINATQTTIALSSFAEPGTNIPYTMTYLNSDIEYATINPIGPGNPTGNKSEFISFTGITQNTNGTALLTGVTRGLSRSYPYTASSTEAYGAPGQTQFILSVPPQFYNEYAAKRNSQVISGQWQFTTLPTSSVACTSGTQFCNKAYIDAGVNQGAATSTFSNLGLVWLANSTQVLAGTASSTTGAPLVIPNKNATSTPTASCTGYACIPVAINGKISQLFLDLTAAFTFSTTTQYFANVGTFTATTSARLPSNTTIGGLTPLFTVVVPQYSLINTTTLTVSASGVVYATSTALVIPAGTLNASSTINVQGNILGCSNNNSAQNTCSFGLYDSITSKQLATCSITSTASGGPNIGTLFFTVANQSSLSSQTSISTCSYATTNLQGGTTVSSSLNTANAVNLVMVVSSTNAGGVNAAQLSNFSIVVKP